jgi:type IX secretion system PorP/SprF family membrane protein
MTNRRFIFILLPVFIGFTCSSFFAQQTTQFSQWSTHQFAFNPAHAGIKSCLDVHSLYRAQWVGFDGAPTSGFFTLSAPIATKRKKYLSARQGVGLRFETDKIGQFSTNKFNLAYAAHFNFSKDTRLSLGVFAGMVQMGYDPSNSVTLLPDPTVSREASFIVPDATFGAWWNGKNYYFGLVLQNLIRSKWESIGNQSFFQRHALLHAGYRSAINERVTLLPGALLKIPPGGPVALDLQLLADFRNTYQVGVAYRTTDAWIAFIGVKIQQRFSIQYSLDLTVSPLQKSSSNTHELSVSFSTCKPVNTNPVKCPLFE